VETPLCPKCQSEHSYEDRGNLVCALCAHEWNPKEEKAVAEAAAPVFKDAYGNILQDGDTITVNKDLKIKGSSSVVKVGTKVKNIRLMDSGDGHDIACKIPGIGEINLKSEFVKKA
tara:strand:- start:1064 stop:1411 length:348 start_codon:yes stop_codon:yes gene_type:complete